MGEWRDKNVTSATKREEGGTLYWGRLDFPLQISVHPECDLIWGKYLKRRWALNPKTGVLLRRGEDTQMHRTAREDEDIGWGVHKLRSGTDGSQSSEVSTDRWNSLPQNLQKEPSLTAPWFQTSGLQSCERINVYCFKPLSLESFPMAALEIYMSSYNLLFIYNSLWHCGKEPACPCRRPKRRRFDPWVRKIPWRRDWQLPPVFFLENPMDTGAGGATVHGVSKSWRRLKRLSTHMPGKVGSQEVVNIWPFTIVGYISSSLNFLWHTYILS